ncbi:hypothetical protein [uncultured Treponema sp.]|uniref:hypothetical protein n=1 Tax=uncultured Treponema sp. TaxID=162155 RepID=UPI0025852071|nr:hypothetical protein [uncultured Treponema sp.]
MQGIAVLAFILCCLNITGWLVFLRKFKRLFTTEDIISKTRLEVTRMIEDVNRTTSKNLDLIEEKIKQLKATSADAERHIAVAKSELEKRAALAQFNRAISEKSEVSHKNEIHPKTQDPSVYGSKAPYGRISDALQASSAYQITSKGKKEVAGEQGELFEQQEENYIKSPSGTKFMVDNEGTGFASIPKIGENVFYSDNPIKPKKTINEQIKELSDRGYDIEMIARELGLTTTEVQFSLDMGF